jgi:adenylate cyclase
MIHLGIGRDEPALSVEERRWRREVRSAWLRLGVFGILIANLLLGEHGGNLLVHANVVVGYGLATVLALGLAHTRRGPGWLAGAFVVVDALAVVALFHEHLFAADDSFSHALTTTNLAIAFVLLTHVALRLRPLLVSLYAGLVVVGWLSLLFIKSAATLWQDTESVAVLEADSALAAAFAFAAFVAFLLIRDHDSLLRSALRSERRRLSLSRFFSPDIVTELERGRIKLDLERRVAAVMFVDLRSFTRFAEAASAKDLAELLIEYRTNVMQAVFEWGGTVDKFIGDGVMAVFGQPRPKEDDAERAIRCALHLSKLLARWKSQRLEEGRPALDAGIGLHLGPVIGGVLESGHHHEFTVLGDAVNVAERLERLAKTLDAALVISAETINRVPTIAAEIPWRWKDGVELEGRSAPVCVAYLARGHIEHVARVPDTGP